MKSSVSRRDFLKLMALTAGAASVPAFPALPPDSGPLQKKGGAQKVIVVGAGLAGLSAAYELTRAGHEVIVLEAQMRAGGRVLTWREPFTDGLYDDVGAARIPDNHDWTLKYVRHFGLSLTPFYPEEREFVSYLRGASIRGRAGQPPDLSRYPLALTPEEQALGLYGLVEKALGEVLREAGDLTDPEWPPAPLRRYDRMTFQEFLRSRGLSVDVYDLLMLGYFDRHLNVSALEMIRHLGLEMTETRRYKIIGGNDLLPKAFASRLADQIDYGVPVVRIEHTPTGVRAICLRRGAPQPITADRLICAIPFTMLRRIEVDPPLSADKQRAITEMAYLSLARVLLQVKKPLWQAQGWNGFAKTDLPAEIWYSTFDRPGPRGVVQVYVKGGVSEQVTAMPEAERLRWAQAHVARVFPGLEAQVEGGVAKCWDQDDWVRGGVAFLQPGQVTTLQPMAARPEGRMHFAGEHTSAWHGWMQGALESGHRAAREVNEGTG
jgi:monoamine oxidase